MEAPGHVQDHIDLIGFCQYLKIALAVAIIRSKPPQFKSAEEYADHLFTEHLNSVDDIDRSNKILRAEILSLKQKLLLQDLPNVAERAGPVLPLDTPSSLSPHAVTAASDAIQEPSTISNHAPMLLTEHSKFLHSLLLLSNFTCLEPTNPAWSPESMAVTVETIASSMEIIAKWISSAATCQQNVKMCEHSVELIAKLVDVLPEGEPHRQIFGIVPQFIHSLVCAIVLHQKTDDNTLHQDCLCNLLQLLCKSAKITIQVIGTLVQCIHDSSHHLRNVLKHQATLAHRKIENVFYIMWTLENILMTVLQDGIPGWKWNFENEVTSLEDSLLHISEKFPLFAHFVWRLLGLFKEFSEQSKSLIS